MLLMVGFVWIAYNCLMISVSMLVCLTMIAFSDRILIFKVHMVACLFLYLSS